MEIKPLQQADIVRIYQQELVFDFPPDETKPLTVILEELQQGSYLCYGAYESGKLIGYSFLVKYHGICLLDYFAVCRPYRADGYGSLFLQELLKQTRTADCFLVEVESPESAGDAQQEYLRNRRLRFYMRNGFRNSQVRVNTFGVEYLLLVPKTDVHSSDAVCTAYQSIYRSLLPEELYRSNILT